MTNNNSTVVTATRSAGSGTLQGTTNITAVGGLVTFTNLSHNIATNISINFTSTGLTNAVSDPIAVSPYLSSHHSGSAAARLNSLPSPALRE